MQIKFVHLAILRVSEANPKARGESPRAYSAIPRAYSVRRREAPPIPIYDPLRTSDKLVYAL